MRNLIISAVLLLFFLSPCASSPGKKDTLFTILPSSQTNVDFNNKIVEADSTAMMLLMDCY